MRGPLATTTEGLVVSHPGYAKVSVGASRDSPSPPASTGRSYSYVHGSKASMGSLPSESTISESASGKAIPAI